MNITDITPIKPESNAPIRLAAYCRVSSDSEDQLHSFAAQIRYYKDYERKHPGYKLVDIYADEGITGTSMEKRDEMHRLIRDCKKGLIDRVIAKSISRFARNTQELIATMRMLKDLGVSIYFEEQGIDSDKLNSEMIVTFPGMAAQQESLSISDNMRWSYRKRMESGEFNCCDPAYGFTLIEGSLVINEKEAAVVKRIFSMYLQGYGKQAIANKLNEDGVPRRHGKKMWYAFGISYILNNERYIGDALLQKKYTTDTIPFKKKRNHGERMQYYVENANPAIISRETYEAAKELQRIRSRNAERKKNVHVLNGMLRCSNCGRTYRKQPIRGKAYWTCCGKASGATKCSCDRVLEADIYEAFNRMIFKLKEHKDMILGTLISDLETMQFKTSGNRERISAIDKELADLSARNLVIVRLHTSGILNASDYSAQSSEINGRISALRAERRKQISGDEYNEQIESIKELAAIIEEYEPDTAFKDELFTQITEQVIVLNRSEMTFRLLGGVQLTEKIAREWVEQYEEKEHSIRIQP